MVYLSRWYIFFILEANHSKNHGVPLYFPTASLPNIYLIYFKMIWVLAILIEHMQKKFEINWTKIKGGCQSGSKVVPHDFMSDLPLVHAIKQCMILWYWLPMSINFSLRYMAPRKTKFWLFLAFFGTFDQFFCPFYPLSKSPQLCSLFSLVKLHTKRK